MKVKSMSPGYFALVSKMTPRQRLGYLVKSIGGIYLFVGLVLSIFAFYQISNVLEGAGHYSGGQIQAANEIINSAEKALIASKQQSQRIAVLAFSIRQNGGPFGRSVDTSELRSAVDNYRFLVIPQTDATLSKIANYKSRFINRSTYIDLFSTSAQAATPETLPYLGTIDGLRPAIMVLSLVIITVFFFLCLALFCVAKAPEKIEFANNMIRMIIGFYIGIATGLLGIPSK